MSYQLSDSTLQELLRVAEKAKNTQSAYRDNTDERYHDALWNEYAEARSDLREQLTTSASFAVVKELIERRKECAMLRGIINGLGDVIEGRTIPLEEVRRRYRSPNCDKGRDCVKNCKGVDCKCSCHV